MDTSLSVRGLSDTVQAAGSGRVLQDCRGAVFVEFLIAFLPVYVFFLCLIQLTILFASKLITEHAAVHAARAAAVVIGDEPSRYDNEKVHQLAPGGAREKTVRKAVVLTLAPLILTGMVEDVELIFPEPDVPGGEGKSDVMEYTPMGVSSVSKVRTRVVVRIVCRIGFANKIACPPNIFSFGSIFGSAYTRSIVAEAVYPYQGARYDY